MRRLALAGLLAGAVLAVPHAALAARHRPDPAAPARAAADASACDAAHAMPASAAEVRRVNDALLCLINHARAQAGLSPLRANRCLAKAARNHARDMVRRHYFDHTTPSGERFDQRISATGYTAGVTSWTVGENLAWGTSPTGDPAWVVRAWMHSPPHRANLLSKAFGEVGVGVAHGSPSAHAGRAAGDSGTYAVDFGGRTGKRARCA
jgi:uncharacterized protein YkwD